MPFTDRQIAALKAKAQRYDKAEPGRTGLRIRVNSDGSKSWTFIYRFDGKQKRMLLGHYEKSGLKPDQTMSLAQAHIALAEAKGKLRAGIDPGAEVVEARAAERNAKTVADLVAEYIERHAKPNMKPNTAAEDERILNREVVPKYGRDKAKDIKRRDLIVLLDRISDRGAVAMRNRVASVLSRLFRFAMDRGIIDANPAVGIRRLDEGRGRGRFLSMKEIHDFWHGLDRVSGIAPVRIVLKFALVNRGG